MKAKRPTNITEDSPVHYATEPFSGGLVCDPERGFGALWHSPVEYDEVTFVAGHADNETNFRFTYTTKRVTCQDCLAHITGVPVPSQP